MFLKVMVGAGLTTGLASAMLVAWLGWSLAVGATLSTTEAVALVFISVATGGAVGWCAAALAGLAMLLSIAAMSGD